MEALPRGASSATFVERDRRALEALHRNLRELSCAEPNRVLGTSVHAALKQLSAEGACFGWVFLDPPYAAGEVEPVLEQLCRLNLLASGAVVVVEHDKRHQPPQMVGTFHLTDRRFYGDTGVSFYRSDTGLA